MPPSREDLQYVNIRDFTPGISDAPGANYPPGSAQRTNTYRCIANRNGALVPMPARTIPFTLPLDYPPGPLGGIYGLIGLYAPPISMLPFPGNLNPTVFPEHELIVANEWLDGASRSVIVRRYRRFEFAGGYDVIKNLTVADVTDRLIPSGMGFGTTRSNRATPTDPGCPVVIMMYTQGLTFAFLDEFPDDQSPNSATPYEIFNNNFLLGICCHQGRVVAQHSTSFGQGPNAATFMGENVIWSNVNDVTGSNWLTVPQVFVPENPSGFAFLASMSANEMFAVKVDGGMYVTGDLNAPTVVSLPMVVGTEVTQTPVVADMGLVYVSPVSGCWVWPHGDTSTLLSPTLKPDFWVCENDTSVVGVYGGVRYQLARCNEWVLLPNNWVYDSRLKSWWRLEDPNVGVFRRFTTAGRFIYGSKSFYTNADLAPVHMWQRDIPAASMSWQSQPLWETVGNLIDARVITIRAAGTGTVKVTLQGETSAQSVLFEVNNPLPVLGRQTLRLQDANCSVRIESTGGAVAPTIYECNVGYLPAQLASQLQ